MRWAAGIACHGIHTVEACSREISFTVPPACRELAKMGELGLTQQIAQQRTVVLREQFGLESAESGRS
jgi:hypothetical protein